MAANRSMGRTASTIGMMEGAFFVSRGDLLHWVNSLLQVNLAKVEQCANAAVYCQIIDACHPNTVAMRKVNWQAKSDHEFVPNYKVLQSAFDKNCIERHIDVDKLIRAKYQDNLEFLQWMKCYWEREGSGRSGYDPLQAREGKQLPPWASRGQGLPLQGGGGLDRQQLQKENLRPQQAEPRGRSGACSPQRPAPAGAKATKPTSIRAASPLACSNGAAEREARPKEGPRTQKVVEDLKAQVVSQQEELDDIRITLDGLERERDFYFRKLRSVELLCTKLEAKADPEVTLEKVVKEVQGILYAEQEEESKAVPAEAEEAA